MDNRAVEKQYVIAGLGEMLWDIHPGIRLPGGAPANVAYHATMLGNHGTLFSRVGHDILGSDLKNFLNFKGVDVSNIQIDDNGAATGTVKVQTNGEDAEYLILEDVAWDHIDISDNWKNRAPSVDAVCFGTLAQRNERSNKAIREFLECLDQEAIKLLDINLREPFYNKTVIADSLQYADILKMNRVELGEMQTLFGFNQVFEWAYAEFGIEMVIITKGSEGSELITRDEHLREETATSDAPPIDVIGAGDAFSAAFLHYYLRKLPLDQCLEKANSYASYIAHKQGAMPNLTPEEIYRFTY